LLLVKLVQINKNGLRWCLVVKLSPIPDLLNGMLFLTWAVGLLCGCAYTPGQSQLKRLQALAYLVVCWDP